MWVRSDLTLSNNLQEKYDQNCLKPKDMELLKLWNISQKIALTTTILFCLDENKVILLQGTCYLDGALIFLNYNWFPLCKPETLTNYKR